MKLLLKLTIFLPLTLAIIATCIIDYATREKVGVRELGKMTRELLMY